MSPFRQPQPTSPASSPASNPASAHQPVPGQTIGELINLSGRQRMLSQRLVLHVVLAAHGDATALPVARDCLAAFATAHDRLVHGDDILPGIFSTALRELYLGAGSADARVRRFIAVAHDAIAALDSPRAVPADDARITALIAQATPFLDVLQTITVAYQHELRDVEAAAQRGQTDIVERLGRISMQANIVAMNGRVSAARAGEHGREFAVITTVLADIIKEMDQLIHSVVGDRGARSAPGDSRRGSARDSHAQAAPDLRSTPARNARPRESA